MGFWGRWRLVVLCIVGIEIGERLAFYGISANLVTYLTHVLHEGTEVSATNVNNWIGATFIAPLLGAFLADAFWGRFWTILIFGTVYFVVSAQSSSPFSQLVRSTKSHYWPTKSTHPKILRSLKQLLRFFLFFSVSSLREVNTLQRPTSDFIVSWLCRPNQTSRFQNWALLKGR